MRQSLKEYIPAVGQRWWAMILFVGGDIIALISGVSGNIILVPWWAWLIIGTVALTVAQFLAYHKVRKQRDEARNEVADVISELEPEIISVSGQSISMARLFWAMGHHFVRGIHPDNIFGAIRQIFPEDRRLESAEAEQNLMYKLRLLELIRDEQRQHRTMGYVVTITTSLGDSVIKELTKKWGDSPWPPSVSEQISNKEGCQA